MLNLTLLNATVTLENSFSLFRPGIHFFIRLFIDSTMTDMQNYVLFSQKWFAKQVIYKLYLLCTYLYIFGFVKLVSVVDTVAVAMTITIIF